MGAGLGYGLSRDGWVRRKEKNQVRALDFFLLYMYVLFLKWKKKKIGFKNLTQRERLNHNVFRHNLIYTCHID